MAITATMAEAQNDYYKAMRAGKREGETLPNLDDILKEKNIVAVREVPLGLVQIPSELIVGTKTAGRSSAFSKGFKPLLKENTEFAYKWMALYKAHLNEGIREPIKAYEFMNKFYVEEGNKRVSVLKYYEAVKIPGTVTRLVPERNETLENKIYYEFLDFYKLSKINYVHFSGRLCQIADAGLQGYGRELDRRRPAEFRFPLHHVQPAVLCTGRLGPWADARRCAAGVPGGLPLLRRH